MIEKKVVHYILTTDSGNRIELRFLDDGYRLHVPSETPMNTAELQQLANFLIKLSAPLTPTK